MTPRFTAGSHRLMPARSKPTCRSVSSSSRVGRPAIGCSWTHRRQSLFGALLRAVAITFPMETYKSATAQFIRSSQPETSVCTSTVAWRWDSHQSCTVVMLLGTETDQIHHAVSAITRAKHSRHCSGSQPVGLLQCCLRWSSSLWHPATTVSPQHSRTSGRRLIATRSRDFSATRPPLAVSQTAHRIQAVYDNDGTSLLVRWRTILPGGPDHAVSRCNCQTWSQICRIQFTSVPRTISSLGDRSFAAAGPRAWNKLPPPLRRVYSPATFKRQLKTFLYNHAFNSHC